MSSPTAHIASAWQTARVTPPRGQIWRRHGSENRVNWQSVAERSVHGSRRPTNDGRPADRLRRCLDQTSHGRECDRVRVPRPRRRRCAARPAAALPRQPRQLGPRPRRRPRRGSTGGRVRQRRRRGHDRHDAEHRRGHGPRRHRVHRGAEPAAGGSARLLARQLRRAGDRADPPRPAAARRARVLRSAGCGGDARLGTGGDRRGRRAGDEPAGIPLRLLRTHQPRAGKRGSRPPGASSGERATGTNRRHGRPARRSTTPSARGASPTTRCSSGSPRSTCRCSSPTATATR